MQVTILDKNSLSNYDLFFYCLEILEKIRIIKDNSNVYDVSNIEMKNLMVSFSFEKSPYYFDISMNFVRNRKVIVTIYYQKEVFVYQYDQDKRDFISKSQVYNKDPWVITKSECLLGYEYEIFRYDKQFSIVITSENQSNLSCEEILQFLLVNDELIMGDLIYFFKEKIGDFEIKLVTTDSDTKVKKINKKLN